MPLPIIGELIGGIGKTITGFFQKRGELKDAKHARKIALENALAKSTADWEITALEAGKFSWKDEFVTVVILLPFIVLFVGLLLDILIPGVGTLVVTQMDKIWLSFANAPQWYQWSFMAVVGAAIGVKGLTEWKRVSALTGPKV